jgi:8-oxo-dGTP pyrophosphatase MutT (NUDIX family)
MSNPFEVLAETELEHFVAASRDFAASGRAPATPRLAATVVLMRADFTVLLMRRSMGMVFGGRWAFPGGSADLTDAQDAIGPCYDPDTESRTARRAAVREVLEETGLDLDPVRLLPWSRWVTPVFEPRRFDTYFFIALVDDRDLDVINGEADQTQWVTPPDAVAGQAAGDLPMLPPTVITLTELAECGSPEGVVAAAAARDARTPILPEL